MGYDVYVAPKVSVKAVNTFFKTMTETLGEVHCIEIYQHGGLLLRIAPPPYHATDKRLVFSLSKSFTSTAVGFLSDEGKVSVDEYIIDIFPDKLPEQIPDNLKKMQVKHLLSMNTGHADCVKSTMMKAEDAVRAFLSQSVPYAPGTHFVYNTGASCMLDAIVEKRSGRKLIDYLTEKLFVPLGISGQRFNYLYDGTSDGGSGFHLSCDDIARVGLLYLNRGVWNGKRILSEEWIRQATHKVSDNNGWGGPDWSAGYGYQFWMNSRGGYRGDGARGQLCYVLPEEDMVIAVQACLGNMQEEINILMDFIPHMFDPDDPVPLLLPDYGVCPSRKKVSGFEGIYYRLSENPLDYTGLYFGYDSADQALSTVFVNGTEHQTIRAGNGTYVESLFEERMATAKPMSTMSTADIRLSRIACAYTAEDGRYDLVLRYLTGPFIQKWTVRFEGDEVRICREDEDGHFDLDHPVFSGRRV